MANQKKRYTNTRFWNDSYVAELDPSEKLLFIYFLTNEHTNISGIYELPIKIIAIETGFENTMIKRILLRLKDKVRYVDGYVVVKNWLKHQELRSADTKKGVLNCLADLDRKWVLSLITKGLYHVPEALDDTPYRGPIGSPTYLDSDLDSNLDSDSKDTSATAPVEPKAKKKFSPLGPEVIKAFEAVDPKNKTYYSNTTQRKAADFLVEEYGMENVLAVIGVLPETNKLPYFPAIHTPFDLKEKWVKLGDAYEKRKKEKSKVTEKLKSVIW